MDKVEVEVLSLASNAIVVQTPWRNFPSMLVQGDSLYNMLVTAKAVLDMSRSINNADLLDEAEDLVEKLQMYVSTYEAALQKAGRPLPW